MDVDTLILGAGVASGAIVAIGAITAGKNATRSLVGVAIATTLLSGMSAIGLAAVARAFAILMLIVVVMSDAGDLLKTVINLTNRG